jgi:hypothetical protein
MPFGWPTIIWQTGKATQIAESMEGRGVTTDHHRPDPGIHLKEILDRRGTIGIMAGLEMIRVSFHVVGFQLKKVERYGLKWVTYGTGWVHLSHQSGDRVSDT